MHFIFKRDIRKINDAFLKKKLLKKILIEIILLEKNMAISNF